MKRSILLLWLLLPAIGGLIYLVRHQPLPPVKVGILHSQTGTMAISEAPVINATLLAIEEINQGGGILGRTIEPVVADGASTPARFAREAERLLQEEKVVVLFGCWTSASRKEVKAVVEAAHGLLVYPLQYEGVENSSNIIYTGSVPNQQIKPAVKWALDHLGERFFLIGSDYIFPRMANTLISDMANFLGAEIVGESYLPLGGNDFTTVVEAIDQSRPSVIFNTLNGDSNLAFFQALKKRGLTAGKVPIFSFSLAETEIQAMTTELGEEALTGNYAAWSYFESLPNPHNVNFIKRYRSRYGAESRISDPMVSAYLGVRLWQQAVEEAGDFAPSKVINTFGHQSLNGPGGIIYIDGTNRHAWKAVRIGRINSQGVFDIVWDSQRPIQPQPYPIYSPRNRWQNLEDSLYRQWGEQWEYPAEGDR